MNLVEAVKSGQPFKRPNFTFYLRPDYDLEQFSFKREDFLADDWVVEEKEITITTSQFDEAVKRTSNKVYKCEYNDVHICDYLKALQKELGL